MKAEEKRSGGVEALHDDARLVPERPAAQSSVRPLREFKIGDLVRAQDLAVGQKEGQDGR